MIVGDRDRLGAVREERRLDVRGERVGVDARPQADVQPVEGERVAEERARAVEAVEDAVLDEVVRRRERGDRERARAAGVRILER